MNKIITTAAIALATITLSACATPSESDAEVTPAQDPIAAAPAYESEDYVDTVDLPGLSRAEWAYVSYFEEQHGDMYAEGEATILAAAAVTCDAFDDGLPPGWALDALTEYVPVDEAVTIMAGSVFAYCPEHEGWLTAG